MARRQLILVAALLPAIFATNATNATTGWNAANVAALILAGKAALGQQMLLASGNSSLLTGFAITSLTSVASGPQIDGVLTFTLTSVTAALAHKDFWRWIATAIAAIAGVPASQVEASAGARRLAEQLRRLTGTVKAKYTVFNPNRGRNIALGVGLAVGVPLAVGAGVAIGMTRPDQSTPAPSTPAPVTAAPVVLTTAAPESASSMPLWAGILLALALLAAIGAAVMLMQKKDKKKRAVKKAAPVVEEVKVIEEVVPMLAPAPVQYIQTAAPTMTYQSVQAAPQVMYAQQPPQAIYAPGPAYTTVSRQF